jgi:hypothetical protein
MFVFEHDEILDPEIRFGVRNGSEFGLGLYGRYPFFGRGEDDLQITAKIRFLGAQVWAGDVEEGWRRLCEHLDGGDFKPDPVRAFGKWPVAGRSCVGFEPLLS